MVDGKFNMRCYVWFQVREAKTEAQRSRALENTIWRMEIIWSTTSRGVENIYSTYAQRTLNILPISSIQKQFTNWKQIEMLSPAVWRSGLQQIQIWHFIPYHISADIDIAERCVSNECCESDDWLFLHQSFTVWKTVCLWMKKHK